MTKITIFQTKTIKIQNYLKIEMTVLVKGDTIGKMHFELLEINKKKEKKKICIIQNGNNSKLY